MEKEQKSVIFFDGLCGLCNGFVNFILIIDRKNHYLFSPLQSEFALKTLPPEYLKDLDSVICMEGSRIYKKSNAVLLIMKRIGGPWKMVLLGYFLPEWLRDMVYDFVAKNRYRFFGKKSKCRLPTPEERSRFLN